MLYVGIATVVHGATVILAAQLRPWLVEGPGQQTVRRTRSLVLAFVAIWLARTTWRRKVCDQNTDRDMQGDEPVSVPMFSNRRSRHRSALYRVETAALSDGPS